MKNRWIRGLVALCFAGMLGCSGAEKPALVVYCGAGLRPPVAELIERFAESEQVTVEPTYDGSEKLLAKLELTERGDIYIPGDAFYLEQAADRGLVLERADAAFFIPVIAVRKGNPLKIKGLADLTRPEVKVGLGEARACAVGRTSASMLQRAGILDKVKPVVTTGTVNELGTNLQLGMLDAAIIWDAVARFYPDEVETVPIETEFREVSTVPVGVLRFTKDRTLAVKFMKLVSSDEGKKVFLKHGYTVSVEETTQ